MGRTQTQRQLMNVLLFPVLARHRKVLKFLQCRCCRLYGLEPRHDPSRTRYAHHHGYASARVNDGGRP
eukprot:1907106-Pyramimonas_sp.AAC.1